MPDYPGKTGPLAGIAAGLASLPAGGAGIFVACDLPFLNTRVVSRIARHLADHQAVVPRWNGFIEPLAAGYSASLLEPVLAALERGDREVRSFLPHTGVFYLEGDPLTSCGDPRRLFFNINTIDDYRRALMETGGLNLMPEEEISVLDERARRLLGI